MKIKHEVDKCDVCDKLFIRDAHPEIKLTKLDENTANVVSYLEVDLCPECIKKFTAILKKRGESNE